MLILPCLLIDLDASLDNSESRAVIYSSPTIVDLENDGKLEIVQATGVGYTYIITDTGVLYSKTKPILTDTVYAPVVAMDLTGDGITGMISKGSAISVWLIILQTF